MTGVTIRAMSKPVTDRLLTALQAIQESQGAVSDTALKALSQARSEPLYRLEGLRSFYPVFREIAGAPHRLQICRDGPCRLKGQALAADLQVALDGRQDLDIEMVSCLGLCDCAPASALNETPGPLPDASTVIEWLDNAHWPIPVATNNLQRLPTDPYPGVDCRYGAIKAWRDRPAEDIIREIEAAGLQGLGGAAFPTARKWAFTRAASGEPRTVICNADESEPGTFKDRHLLENAPHLVIEGMLLGGVVIGASLGVIYLRHEYHQARRRIEEALATARGSGVLGPDARGPGLAFDIELFVSPGGYILGEETALLEALEDRRGEPRHKPPFPTTVGLHGGPTLINNVETLAAVTTILARGASWWRAQGRGEHAGLKYICVSGDIKTPQVLCLPWGSTVAEAIEGCGGLSDGRNLLAFSPGGASTPFLPPTAADTPMTFDDLRAAGSGLGTGALFVVGTGRSLADVLLAQAHFFRNESCGKCVPCRVGSAKGVEMAESALEHSPAPIEQALETLHHTLSRTSICGLGQVALLPLVDGLRRFPDEPSLKPLKGFTTGAD